jgi:exopolysaccharide biosynthesis protein
MQTQSIYSQLGTAMTHSVARKKFAIAAHDENDREVKKIHLQLDAIAKVLLDNHGVKVTYMNNSIIFSDSTAGQGKRVNVLICTHAPNELVHCRFPML